MLRRRRPIIGGVRQMLQRKMYITDIVFVVNFLPTMIFCTKLLQLIDSNMFGIFKSGRAAPISTNELLARINNDRKSPN